MPGLSQAIAKLSIMVNSAKNSCQLIFSKMLFQLLCQSRSYDGRLLVFVGIADVFNRLKGTQQLLGSFFTYPGDLSEFSLMNTLGSLFSMKIDRKAVCFISGLLDQLEGF